MVSQNLSVYASSDGGRFTRSYHGPYSSYISERRFQLHPHDSRVMTMPDSEAENDGSNTRKRISVACGRCRKRKIRCSGDPGGGQPCSNCKNAGSEPCLFLRVSSTEAALRNDHIDYNYSVQDARIYSNRHIGHNIPFSQELSPPTASHEFMSPYRGGSTYSYASKPFYSTMPSYSMGYVEDLSDYHMSNSAQPVLAQDMVPYASWTSRGDYPYSGATTSLAHRPAPAVTVDSTNFSLSNMAAHLPGSTVTSSDRLLPAPSNRSLACTSSHSYKVLPPTGGNDPSPADAAAVLAEMASSSYGSSFDTSGLSYSSSATSLQAHNDHSSHSPDSDSIFTEHEHSLRSQGSVVDLHTYTYGGGESAVGSLRRGSAASGGPVSGSGSNDGNNNGGSKGGTSGGGGRSSSSVSVASNHHGYMPVRSVHDSASSSHHHHHQLPLATHGSTNVVSGGTASTAYLPESSASSGGHNNPGGICNGSMHGDTRRAALGCRR